MLFELSDKEQQLCRWIDNASYEALLQKWRFASPGDPLFQGGVVHYYQEVMGRKKAEAGESATTISKRGG